MNIVLSAKHWQVFIVVVILPIIVSSFSPDTISSDSLVRDQIKYILLTIILSAPLIIWYWLIGSAMHNLIPKAKKISLISLNIILSIFLITFIAITIFISNSAARSGSIHQAMFDNHDILFLIIMITLILLILGLGILAKLIKSAELGKAASLRDYYQDFFMLFFYPIGIWIIQPRLNELAPHREDF